MMSDDELRAVGCLGAVLFCVAFWSAIAWAVLR